MIETFENIGTNNYKIMKIKTKKERIWWREERERERERERKKQLLFFAPFIILITFPCIT